MKFTIETKVATGFILSLIIIASFSITTYFNMHALIQKNTKHHQSQLLLRTTNEIKVNMFKAESATRDFALTGSDSSSMRFYSVEKSTYLLLHALKISLSECGTDPGQYDKIMDRYNEFIKFENTIIYTKQNKGTTAALALLLRGKFAENGNLVINLLRQIEISQRTSIIEFTQKNINAALITNRSFLILVILMIIILGVIFYLFKADITESKKAKAELRMTNDHLESTVKCRTRTLAESEKKYRLLADNVIDVISLHNSDGNYTYVSESAKSILGYDPEELIGHTGFDFMHPEDVEKIKKIHNSLIISKENSDVIPFRFLHKNGNYIWVESLAKKVVNELGEFEGIVICTRDISARVEAEKAFKDHERMLQSIMDNSSNPIFIKKLSGEYLLVNREFENMMKERKVDIGEGLIGKNMKDLLPAEIFDQETKRNNEIVRTEKTATYELQYPGNKGIKTYSVAKFPMYDDDNNVYAICAIETDITRYKQFQKEILDSKAKLNALIQNSIDPIWSIDKNFKLIDFNYSCRSMISFFYGIEIFPSMNALELNDSESRAEWERDYIKSLNGEYFSKELRVVHNMEDYYYDVSFNPIIVNECVEGVAIFARDVTNHKKTEKQLKYKVNELNTFMYKATHDLRSPLMSLMGLIHLAEKENDITESKNYFGMIGTSVAKMDKLLVDLVNITNVSQGQLVVNKVDFRGMIGEIIDSLKHYPNFENIGIKNKIDDNIPFYGDDKLLYSIMQNLIDNAIKYSRNSFSNTPSVNLNIVTETNFVTISVSDNGIGIPNNSTEKVFDMFYRATTVSSGTGLGLYIVKSGVEKMKGKITLASIENVGTTIYITIPNNKTEKIEKSSLQMSA
jgi:PAS domain S-box-containing protein